MKNKRLILVLLVILTIGLPEIMAQQTVNSSGGDATGSGGTVNYSVGQSFFSSSYSGSSSLSEGVQQTYDFFTTTGTDLKEIQLGVKAYPNPTTNLLYLAIDKVDNELAYQLFNNEGKLISTDKIYSEETPIDMIALGASTYLLSVTKKGQVIKSFTIIKH